ncbi:putative glutamine amidotransferase [Brucella lupini]|uniref:Putative glutamine amidotransferase n=1 Tax=Brucella lupini TaxID=255457 RepID=A0A256GXB4_9HYPH|nr:putative glutamine amidotransferase [Brucella lupini]
MFCLRIPPICRQRGDMADSFVSYRILSLMKRYPLAQHFYRTVPAP